MKRRKDYRSAGEQHPRSLEQLQATIHTAESCQKVFKARRRILHSVLSGKGMDAFEGFFPTPQPKPLQPLDELLRIAAHAPTPPPAAGTPPATTAVQEEAPLVRLEKKLSEIRRVMKKGPPHKPYALVWIRQITPILKAFFGDKNGLIATLDSWLLEIAAGKLEKFPKFVDEIEEQLEALLDMAEGDWLTKPAVRLPRTFVSFSSGDIHYFRTITMWQKHEHMPFNFYNCQLEWALRSEDPAYIKRRFKQRIALATKFILLIGKDTRFKTTYVQPEVEAAVEKGCSIIAVNVDHCRGIHPVNTPAFIRDVGAIFIPFSSRIISFALAHHEPAAEGENFVYPDSFYLEQGYRVVGDKAVIRKS